MTAMYELMVDTANLEEIRESLENWPVCGVTSNPSILKKEGDIQVFPRLAEIRKLCGVERSLHVQVVSNTTEEILQEAKYILDTFGKDTYIKIPVSPAGLPAIKALAAQGVNITATAIYSTMQGILAALAGAKYLAVYVNRMENNCADPEKTIAELRDFLDGSGCQGKILAASFKNVAQITGAYAAGAHSVTVPPALIQSALGMASIQEAVAGFKQDFEAIHGENTTMLSI
jgi:transaldolase